MLAWAGAFADEAGGATLAGGRVELVVMVNDGQASVMVYRGMGKSSS